MFTVVDYCVFSTILILCLCIGIYFGFWRKPHTADEYLLGNRSMKVIPISVSFVVSHISGLTMLALPSDVYIFGANSIWMCLAVVVAGLIGCYAFLPTLIKLKGPNVFEYFEQRFDRGIKIMASCIYTLQILVYNPVAAFIPAIAFSQATGISPHVITPVVCAICVFYTTVGGFKAVVWTHSIQFVGMVAAIVAVVILGTLSAGGVNVVFEKASRGHRLDFNFSIDPTKRDGFWQMVIGFMVTWLYNVNFQPGSVQKYISLSDLTNVKRVIFLQCCGLIVIKFLCTFIGIIMYARYENCDPISTGEVIRLDQILPFFVLDVGQGIPGLSGIFIGGIFCAALSSLSSNFNTLAATIYGDFLSSFCSKEFLIDKESTILRLIVVIAGCICTSLTFAVEHMGGLLAFVNASLGLMCGILVGLFTLGIIFPIANTKGAYSGVIFCLLVMGPIAILNQWYTLKGAVQNFAKPVSVEGCAVPFNFTLPRAALKPEEPFVLFKVSFWYNSPLCAIMVVGTGLLVSFFTKASSPTINSDISAEDRNRLKRYLGDEQCDEDLLNNVKQ